MTNKHHRSRHRIKVLGEVFTPEAYILDMLKLLDSQVWGDENTSFFEPCCGNGNIVEAIINKRLSTLYNKYQKLNKKNLSYSQ